MQRPGWLAVLLLLPLLIGTATAAGYQIDSERSQATFDVRLLWLHTINGRFPHIVGVLQPGVPPDTMVVDASIALASVEMDSPRTRRWLLAPDFFDAEHYPTIHFVSDPISPATLAQGGGLTGQLSMRGMIRPIRFELLPSRCSLDAPQLCRIELHGQLQRSDFNMSGYRGALSNRVDLNLEIALAATLR